MITEGGKSINVIPEKSRMEVAYRAPTTPEVMRIVKPKVEACLQSAAQATGCQVFT